ncbi:hypothetical protein O9A_00018 [Bartonella koehlerae C-29]|uniref:Lysozyme n=1 Tax=Bartonella koehlerae C-29 TaxID=1134510 RepID=A0A067W9P7_9HYPH|nr:hypothetical protein O9A_00018 [Bartonella koehlerae C-29]
MGRAPFACLSRCRWCVDNWLWTHRPRVGNPLVQEGTQITVAEAETLLQKDLVQFEKTVEEMVKQPLNDEQFSALIPFCCNIGIRNFLQF